MKKFFAVLTIALILAGGNVAEGAEEFTREQVDKIFLLTVENPAVEKKSALPIDAVNFQTKFNNYMLSFIGKVSTGEEATTLERIFLLNDPSVTEHDGGIVFAKNFLNRAAVVGYSDGGNFKVLNFFATQTDGRDDGLFSVLILRAFVNTITPDYDAMTLLNEAKKNLAASVIHGNVRYTVTRDGNLNIITAVVGK